MCLGLGSIDEMPLVGGHENSVIRLCKELHNLRNEVFVFTTPSIHSNSNQARIFNVSWGKIYSLPISSTYGSIKYGLEFTFKALYNIKELHRKENFDIIHGHSGHPALALIFGILSKRIDIPLVHTLYCPIESNCNKLSNKFYLSFPSKIISLSNNTQNSLENIGIVKDNIEIIPPPIDTSVFNPFVPKINRKNYGLKSEDLTILYIGDLTEKRGLYLLIEALSIVVKTNPNIKLFLAVNMPITKYNQTDFEVKHKINSLELDKNVVPLGIINNMPEVMATSDVLIAPYLSIETIADYPISALETMACGTPVIATNVGGISEIIKHMDTGLLIQPNNVNDLIDSITFMLQNKDKIKEMGIKASIYIQSNFGIQFITKKYEKIYLDLIKS
jgi:glycosyltransferase involved in cell wall biosynthesis